MSPATPPALPHLKIAAISCDGPFVSPRQVRPAPNAAVFATARATEELDELDSHHAKFIATVEHWLTREETEAATKAAAEAAEQERREAAERATAVALSHGVPLPYAHYPMSMLILPVAGAYCKHGG